MPDNDMLEDAQFENQINALGDDQPALIKFVARQQYDSSKVLHDHGKRIKSLEKKSNKLMGGIGLVSAILATAITTALDTFLRRGP